MAEANLVEAHGLHRDRAERLRMALGMIGSTRGALGAVVIGLVIRIAGLLYFLRFPMTGDGSSYDAMARQLLSGEAFGPVWPPGLPYYLTLFYRVLGERQVVAMASMLLWYLAFSVLLYLLCQRVAGRRAGGFALAVFAVWPTAIYHSIFPLTQLPVATLLVAAAILLVELLQRRRVWLAAAAGAVFGYCMLMRPSAAILAIGAPLVIAWRRRDLRPAALTMLAVAAVVITPWLIRAENMTGRFVPINYANSRNVYLGNNPWTPLYKTWWFGSHLEEGRVPEEFAAAERQMQELPLHQRDDVYRSRALEHILDNPGGFLLRTANRIRVYFSFDTYAGTVLTGYYGLPRIVGLGVILVDALIYICAMLASIAAIFLAKPLDLKKSSVIVLILLALGYAVPYWFSFSHPTYHLPTMPMFIVLAAALVARRLSGGRCGVWNHETIRSLFRRKAFLVCIIVFLYSQLEWAYVMATGLLRG